MSNAVKTKMEVEKEFMSVLVKMVDKKKIPLTDRQKRKMPVLVLATMNAYKKQTDWVQKISVDLIQRENGSVSRLSKDLEILKGMTA